jgi:lysophospholipase L1-like esterase
MRGYAPLCAALTRAGGNATLWRMAKDSRYLKVAAAVLGGWLLANLLGAGGGAGGSGGRLNLAGQRVLLIGSSSAVGVGPRLEAMLKDHGIAGFKNIGISGSSLYQWSDNVTAPGRLLESTLAEYQPGVVFIYVGTNDEAGGGAGTKAPAIERLHRKLQGTRSIFLGLPPHANWTMNRPFRDLLERTWGADFFNTEVLNPAKAPDGYHLSTAGYRTVLTALDKWLAAKR